MMKSKSVMTRIEENIHQKILILKAEKRMKSISEVLEYLYDIHENSLEEEDKCI